MSTTTEEILQKEEWKEKHKEIADEHIQIIQREIPDDILVQGVTIDFQIPSEGQLRIHGIRGEGDIKENVFIFAAPSSYSNAFKNKRRKFYNAIHKYGFVLGKGQGSRNLYLIPLRNVTEFMEKVKELETEFEDLQKDINDYLKGRCIEEEREYLEKVRAYIEKETGIFHKNLDFEVSLNFKVSLMPLQINSDTFMRFADDQVRQKMTESLKILEKEFLQTREEIISRMIDDLNRRFGEILNKLTKAATTDYLPKYKTIERAIDETIALAMSVNLQNNIKPLAEAVESTAKVLCTKNFRPEDLEASALKIARVLKIEDTDTEDILKKATYDLSGMSERAAEVIRRM